MAVKVDIVPATVAHAEALARTLRRGDFDEGLALGLDPYAAAVSSVVDSKVAYAALFDEKVAACAGVVDLGRRTGQVWMLSSTVVDRHPRAFLKTSRLVLERLMEDFDVLSNVIDSRYEAALRWARWLGLEVGEPRPIGPFNVPFCPFVIRRH